MQLIIKWKISIHSASAPKNKNRRNPQKSKHKIVQNHDRNKFQVGEKWLIDSSGMSQENNHYHEQQLIKISTSMIKLTEFMKN